MESNEKEAVNVSGEQLEDVSGGGIVFVDTLCKKCHKRIYKSVAILNGGYCDECKEKIRNG